MITSQIDTAPKLRGGEAARAIRLITSQIDTAPKRACPPRIACLGLITSQIDTAPKPTHGLELLDSFDYQSD